MFSLNSLESFHCLPQHLLEISLAEITKIFLVGNKTDLPIEVTDEDIEQFEEQFHKFSGIYKISCKENEGVEEMFNDICEKLSGSYTVKQAFDTFKLHTEIGCCSNDGINESNSGKDNSCCARN